MLVGGCKIFESLDQLIRCLAKKYPRKYKDYVYVCYYYSIKASQNDIKHAGVR